jgi:hypothetical protein
MDNQALKQLIIARLRAARERDKLQGQLLENTDDFAETVRLKLNGLCETTQFLNFSRCGHEHIYATCCGCGKTKKLDYRCNLKWCPRCQQRLSRIRKNLIFLWAKKITQPKHLVVTQKNFPVLTRRAIKEHTLKLAKLRRSKCFRNVRGGCVSTEITNEGNGWHLHAHMLLNVRWLDMRQISIKWGKLVGQKFAIVRVADLRDQDYVHEVCKYVVEGSELAKWQPEQINEFVLAVRGLRLFNSFGTLRELAPQIRRELAAQKPAPPVCECGSCDFTYEDEATALSREAEQLGWQSRHERHVHAAFSKMRAAAAASAGQPELL